LLKVAAEVPGRDSSALTRLPIDRVFSMKGFGTVITGTLISGTISKDDELELFPARKKVRVRGVQVHGTSAERAVAGQRTALNLSGIEKDQLARGMVLASPAALHPTLLIDAKLTLLSSAKPLKKSSRVHFHAFASETIGSIAIRGDAPVVRGCDIIARIRLNQPQLLFPGDRFIIRQFSPVVTIGGGQVLDASPIPKLKPEAVEHLLNVTSANKRDKILLARISRRWLNGTSMQSLVAETGWTSGEIARLLDPELASGVIIKAGELFFDCAAISALKSLLLTALQEFHRQNSLSSGIAQETLREQSGAGSEAFSFAISALVREGRIQVSADEVHLAGRGVSMKDEEAESRKTIEDAFTSAGLQVPALKDVLASLKIDRIRAQKIVTLLLREKTLVKVSDDLVFHRAALAGLRTSLAAQKLRSPRIDVAGFKSLTGVSRKYAIPLLEYLDRERVTRRVGDERVIL
jgi:selenocysteine-specific elongation factor